MPAGNTIIRKMVFSGHPFVSIAPCLWPDVLLRSYVSIPRPRINPFSMGHVEKIGSAEVYETGRGDGTAEATVTKETMDRRVRRGRAEVRLTARIRIED